MIFFQSEHSEDQASSSRTPSEPAPSTEHRAATSRQPSDKECVDEPAKKKRKVDHSRDAIFSLVSQSRETLDKLTSSSELSSQKSKDPFLLILKMIHNLYLRLFK